MSFGQFQVSDMPHTEQEMTPDANLPDASKTDSRVTIYVTTDEHLVNDQAADALGRVDNL